MWNKSNLLLWISIKKGSKNSFRFPIPLPLIVVQEIFEAFLELMVIGNLFVARRKKYEVKIQAPHIHHFSIVQINEVLVLLGELLSSLTDCEAFELVNVKTPEVEVVIKIR